ncbi:TPA: biotin/lipoyl-binding protein [Acinetobacter baumannii]|nr:biotin/lipoyl-binding protein [Acinetobacter baumannii]HAV5314973.1 biotin/lipoyl-binding protein [Acinetobacter baumannii]
MNKKVIAGILVVIAVVAIGFWVWGYNHKKQLDNNVLTLYGNVDIRQVSLAFEQSGRIQKLLVQEGDKVQAGQVLAALNTNALQIQAKQAQAQLKAQQEAIVKQEVGARPEEITHFESKLNNNQSSPIQIIVDGRNSSTAMVAGSYLNKIIGQFNQQKFNSALPISLETRTWYNPNQESRWSLMPALIAALSMMQTLLLSALSVAREREQGTFDQLLVTPYTPLQIMIGKALPPIFVGLMQSTIILLIILFWFKIPMNGSIGLLYFGLFSFNVAVVGVGLSISALSLNMQQAMLFTFLLIMPLMLLSGLLTPVENMPKALQVATYANPLRFGINLVQRVYLEGASFAQVKLNFLPMIVLGIVTLPLAAWLFRNRLS